MDLSVRIPKVTIVILATVAVASFLAGALLDIWLPDVLGSHPYFANLLSGVTGFASSAIAVIVVFNRILRRSRAQEWLVEMEHSLTRLGDFLILVCDQLQPHEWVRPPDEYLLPPRETAARIYEASEALGHGFAAEDVLDVTETARLIRRYLTTEFGRLSDSFQLGGNGLIVGARNQIFDSTEAYLEELPHAVTDDQRNIASINYRSTAAALVSAMTLAILSAPTVAS